MELIVLGSSGAWPGPGEAASGYLLSHDGFRLWLDLGTGTLSNLQRHIPHERVDAIVITHEHLDHCLDVYPLYYARYFHPETLERLPVIAAPGVFQRVTSLKEENGIRDMEATFEVREVEPGAAFELGPFSVQTRLMRHWVTNLGLRIAADGASMAYTGDTGPTEEVEAIAKDTALLVAEASWLDSGEERPPYHLTARQAAQHAENAGTPRLLLSHFWPGNDRNLSREQAADAYGGEVLLAEEGMRIEVGG